MKHHDFSGAPVPVSHHLHSREFLPSIQSKPSLFQSNAIAPCPITSRPCKKSLSWSLVTPLQVLKGCCRVFPEPFPLQAEQPQLHQEVSIGEVLHPSEPSNVFFLDLPQQMCASTYAFMYIYIYIFAYYCSLVSFPPIICCTPSEGIVMLLSSIIINSISQNPPGVPEGLLGCMSSQTIKESLCVVMICCKITWRNGTHPSNEAFPLFQ